MGRQLSWKKSLLVIWKILELLVKTLTADHKFSLLNRDKLTRPIQMQLCKNKKAFSQLCSAFLKFRYSFQQFQKKMTLIADVFPKLMIPKNVVR